MRDDEEADEREFLAFQQRSAGAPAPNKVKTRARKITDRFALVPIWWVEQAAKAANTPRSLVLIWLMYLVGGGGTDPSLQGGKKSPHRDPALSLIWLVTEMPHMPWLGHVHALAGASGPSLIFSLLSL